MLLNQYKAVFFDLDGTLIDSAEDMAEALKLVSVELKLNKPTLQQVKSWIGLGVEHLIKQYMIFNQQNPDDKDLFDSIQNLFVQAYRGCLGEYSQLYPYTQQVLVQLLSDNKKISCITNKPFEFAEFLMQQHCIRQFFHIICSGDYVKHKKPHPWALEYCCKKFELTPQECLMVGDSETDIEAAQAAGCDIAVLTSGYNQGRLTQSNPTYQINSLQDLL